MINLNNQFKLSTIINRFNDMLRIGCQTLGMDFGIISHIDVPENRYTVISLYAPKDSGLHINQVFDYDKTYCNDTFQANTPVVILNAAESDYLNHPCYRSTQLESYIGCPITLNKKRFGTINFSSPVPRQRPFTENEIELVQMMASSVSSILEFEDNNDRLRLNHALLDSVTHAQSRFISDSDPRPIFDTLLKDILQLTDSEYGFIGEILYKNNKKPYLKMHAFSTLTGSIDNFDIASINASNGLEFHNLDSLFGHVITHGETLITNDACSHPKNTGLPPGHPELKAFMGVPFYTGHKLIGMVGLANKPQGYNYRVLKYIEPFLTTSANIIEAYRTNQQKLQAIKALHDSENKFRSLFETAQDAVILLNSSGLLDCNAAALRLFGYPSKKEFLSRDFDDISADYQHDGTQSNEAFSEQIQHALRERQNTFTWDFQRRDSVLFKAEVRFSSAKIESTPIIQAYITDITERVKLDRMKDEFISTVSHELRTPLTSIKGSLGLLQGGIYTELDESAQNLVDIAYKNCDRLMYLINDLLDMEKISTGNIEFKTEQVNLFEIVQSSIEANQPYADRYRVDFIIHASKPNIYVKGDYDRLMQVMANLLSNAAKFSRADSEVQINMVEINAEHIRVEIRDFGIGIDPAFRDRLFQKFAQYDASDSRHIGGTGLGLSITKAIIEKHQGHIGYFDNTPSGSVFYFDLQKYYNEANNSVVQSVV